MTNNSDTDELATTRIRWIARIWSIPVIVFSLIMFAGFAWNWFTTGTADPNAVKGFPLTEALPPILLFISILGLIIAWRWENWGGGINLVFTAVTLVVLLMQSPITDNFPSSGIPYLLSMVVVLPGILFLMCWRRSRMMPLS